jgi:rsbT antagonist protein RsbS
MKGQKPAILRNQDILIVPVPGDLDDFDLANFKDHVLQVTSKADVNGLLLDLSGVETIDYHMATRLVRMMKMVGLLDVDSVLVGMRSSVALTLTEMNVSFENIRTARNLEKGLAVLKAAKSDSQGT